MNHQVDGRWLSRGCSISARGPRPTGNLGMFFFFFCSVLQISICPLHQRYQLRFQAPTWISIVDPIFWANTSFISIWVCTVAQIIDDDARPQLSDGSDRSKWFDLHGLWTHHFWDSLSLKLHGGTPPVISWFINPRKYRYNLHNP